MAELGLVGGMSEAIVQTAEVLLREQLPEGALSASITRELFRKNPSEKEVDNGQNSLEEQLSGNARNF